MNHFLLLHLYSTHKKNFDYHNIKGTLVGYFLPEYLNGINTAGFHFHFLSNDKTQGGHALNFLGNHFTIEIAELQDFQLEIPKDKDFLEFNFAEKENEALKRVEQWQ